MLRKSANERFAVKTIFIQSVLYVRHIHTKQMTGDPMLRRHRHRISTYATHSHRETQTWPNYVIGIGSYVLYRCFKFTNVIVFGYKRCIFMILPQRKKITNLLMKYIRYVKC